MYDYEKHNLNWKHNMYFFFLFYFNKMMKWIKNEITETTRLNVTKMF